VQDLIARRGEEIPLVRASQRPEPRLVGTNLVFTQRGTAPALTVQELAGPSTTRALLEAGGTWALLAVVIGGYVWHPRPWTYLAAFVLVASRQYALLILMHDAFHCLLHPQRRINDFVGAWLIGAACGSSYWGSRSSHLEHHRKLGDPSDPEFFLYSSGPPRAKRGVGAFIRHFLRLILGEQILHTHLGPGSGQGVRTAGRLARALRKLLPVAIAQLILLCLFTLAGSWPTYFTLWVLPLLSLVVLFNGLRAFCDHANHTDEPEDEQHRLVSYLSNPLERAFVAPFHMNYHAEHHLFTYVPHYRLPVLRQRLMASQQYSATIQWRTSYLKFVKEFLRGQR
jgi:fatty acid desaturase